MPYEKIVPFADCHRTTTLEIGVEDTRSDHIILIYAVINTLCKSEDVSVN